MYRIEERVTGGYCFINEPYKKYIKLERIWMVIKDNVRIDARLTLTRAMKCIPEGEEYIVIRKPRSYRLKNAKAIRP